MGERTTRERLLRVLLVLVAAMFVLWLLFTRIFPWVESYLQDPTVGVVVGLIAGGHG